MIQEYPTPNQTLEELEKQKDRITQIIENKVFINKSLEEIASRIAKEKDLQEIKILKFEKVGNEWIEIIGNTKEQRKIKRPRKEETKIKILNILKTKKECKIIDLVKETNSSLITIKLILKEMASNGEVILDKISVKSVSI